VIGLPRRAAAATGAAAAQHAADWLQARGLRLIDRNWRCRQGELDLVMQDGATLVVVEVRARRHAGFGGAAGSVDARKCRRIAAATQAWLLAHPQWSNAPLRFDVLAYERNGPCDWLQAAFTTDDLA
jgi:putative endonuclease